MKSSNKSDCLNILNVVAFILSGAATVVVHVAKDALGVTDVVLLHREYQTLLTPPLPSFQIWGLIYLLELVWTFAQLAFYPDSRLVREGVRYNFVFVCLTHVGWTFAFAFEIMWLSTAFMVASTALLVIAVNGQFDLPSEGLKNYWLLQFPLLVHTGWSLAYTVINANLLLAYHDVPVQSQYYCALSSIVIMLAIACVALSQQQQQFTRAFPDLVIPLMLVYALVSIFFRLNMPTDRIRNTFPSQYIFRIQLAAAVDSFIIAFCALFVAIEACMVSSSLKQQEEDEATETRYTEASASFMENESEC